MSPEEENQLVRDAQDNVESFEKLYDAYFPKVFGFIMGKIGKQEAAEDLVSEIFLKVLEGLPRYQFRGLPFGAWVFRIAHNHLKDYYGKASKQALVGQLEDAEWVPSEDETLNPAQMAREKSTRHSLVDAFHVLTDQEEEVIRLKYFSDLKNIEIAETLGITQSHVGVLLHRALKKLKTEHDSTL